MLLTWSYWRAILRSFFIQAAWNFERMQNLGFLYAILPVLRAVWSGDRLLEAARRHAGFFNTHPYFAPLILGLVARLEEAWAHGESGPERQLNALKAVLMGSLGAIGDSLFWAALRPFCAWVAILLAVMGWPYLGVVIFLVAYNAPHLLVRLVGGAIGYAVGLDIVQQLRRVDFLGMARLIKGAAVSTALAVLPLLAWRSGELPHVRVGAVLLAALLFLLIRRGAGGTKLAGGYLALALLTAWAWTNLGER